MLRGIDASQYQSSVNIDALASAADFAIFKATQDDWEDVTFNGTGTYAEKRRFLFREARSAGMIVGAYHFLQHGANGGAAQALTFIRAVKRANNARMDGALCVLFVEHDIKRNSVPDGSDVHAFILEFQRLAPMQPLFIATNAPFWRAHVRLDLQQFDDVYVWLEKWTDASGQIDTVDPMVPAEWWQARIGGRVPTLLQFSSQTRVGGVRASGSLYDGDRASLARLADVSLPYRWTTPQSPTQVRPGRYVPERASDTDDPKKRGKTTLVLTGSLLVAGLALAAVSCLAWSLGKDAAKPIFDGGW